MQRNTWQHFLDYGDYIEHPFRIESGYARARLLDHQVPVLLQPGDLFGIEVLDGRHSKVCIESKDATISALQLDQGELSTSWVNALTRSLDCMSSRSNAPSIARFLLHFTTALMPDLHNLTHADMALFLQTDRCHISKHLARFRRAKIVDYGRFWIKVLDREALHKVAY